MAGTDVPEDVLSWVALGSQSEDAQVAHVFFTRALDRYWQNSQNHDTPTLFERRLRSSLAHCCISLKLFSDVLGHTSRGLQPPCDDLLVDPELWGDLISLEQNACIEVGDYRRAMRRVDGMLQYSPIPSLAHSMRSHLHSVIEAKENEKKELAKKKETLEAVNKEYDRMKNSNMTDESESILPPGFSEQSLRGAIDELTEESWKTSALPGPPTFEPTPDNVPNEAIELINTACEMEPKDALKLFCRGLEIYTRTVGYRETPSEFEQRALVLISNCCLKLNMPSDVIRYTTRVIDLGNVLQHVQIGRSLRGVAYEQLGDFDKALADVAAFREFDPLNKAYIDKHIELEDRRKAKEGMQHQGGVSDSKDSNEVNNLCKEMSGTSLVEIEGDELPWNRVDRSTGSKSAVLSYRDNLRIGLDSDHVNDKGNEAAINVAGAAIKEKSKKQKRAEAYKRQLEGEKIKQEVLLAVEKKAREQQRETEKTTNEASVESHKEPTGAPSPVKKKRGKKKRKRTRRKTLTLRAARDRQGDGSDSDDSSDSGETDDSESASLLDDSTVYGRFAVLQRRKPETEIRSGDMQKPKAEIEEDGTAQRDNDQGLGIDIINSRNLLAQIVNRCNVSRLEVGRKKDFPVTNIRDSVMRPDQSSGQYVNFRAEVIQRGILACWICFVKEGGNVSEIDKQTGRCPVHSKNFWTPMLLWPRTYGTVGRRLFNDRWVEIRPRPHDRDGGLKLCDPRKFPCVGAQCGYPHSEEERDAWILDRDKWRFRRIPDKGRQELCRSYSASNYCSYGNRCLFAHGVEELAEWRLRPKTRDVIDELALMRNPRKVVSTWLDELRSELAKGHNEGDIHIICDQIRGLEIVISPHDICIISAAQTPPFKTRFQILMVTIDDGDCFVRRAALLGNDGGFRFDIDSPLFYVSNNEQLAEAIDGEQEPVSSEIDIAFSTNSKGCYIKDIFMDTGRPPYVHRSIAVAVLPVEQQEVLTQLCNAFQFANVNDAVDVKSAFPDCASLLKAASNVLLHPPETPDEYRQQLHTVLCIQQIFSCYIQERAVDEVDTSVCSLRADYNYYKSNRWAIERLSDEQIKPILHGSSPRLKQVMSESQLDRCMKLIDPDFTSEQRTAVCQILDPRIDCPVRIQGPSGVGKTRVLVEAARLLATSGHVQVLITTKSQRAAQSCVFQLHQLRKSGLAANLIYMCDTDDQTYYDVIRKYRCSCKAAVEILSTPQRSLFLVTTSSDCSHLVGTDMNQYLTFSHILIDEASRSTEAETTFALSLANKDSVVVLAGDKYELSPHRHCQLSEALKFSQSLFTRLRDAMIQGKEVSLTEQFTRSTALVQLSSSIFTTSPSSSSSISEEENEHSIFHSFGVVACAGNTANKSQTDGSFINRNEAEAVVNQVTALMQNWPDFWGHIDASDVFVVSSEHQQVSYIEELLKSRSRYSDGLQYSAVRVGTPWQLQGCGPRVIIVSTVITENIDIEEYSQKRTFLSDEGMLYTVINEARCIVLVVADPYCLISGGEKSVQSKWRLYLQQCCDVGGAAFRGSIKSEDLAMRIKLQSAKLSIQSPEFVPSFFLNDL